MTNENKIIDLKLKIIDIKLEKEKYLHKSLFSFVIAVITFAITYGNIASIFNNTFVTILQSVISFNEILGLVVMILFLILLPVVAYYVSKGLANFFIKSTNKMYDDKIKEIDNIINKLTKTEK